MLGQIYHAYELMDSAEACYVNALRISPADFSLAIRQAEANIRSAEAKLADIEVARMAAARGPPR